jgi:hypothetical protein
VISLLAEWPAARLTHIDANIPGLEVELACALASTIRPSLSSVSEWLRFTAPAQFLIGFILLKIGSWDQVPPQGNRAVRLALGKLTYGEVDFQGLAISAFFGPAGLSLFSILAAISS